MKIIKISSWIFLFLLFFGVVYFLTSFSLFDEPQKVKLFDLSHKNQNYTVVSVFGNAATNGSVQLFEIDSNGNEIQNNFLITRSYFKKGYPIQINDSLFKYVLIDSSVTDTVLLNMEAKKMDYYSDSLLNAVLTSKTNTSKNSVFEITKH